MKWTPPPGIKCPGGGKSFERLTNNLVYKLWLRRFGRWHALVRVSPRRALPGSFFCYRYPCSLPDLLASCFWRDHPDANPPAQRQPSMHFSDEDFQLIDLALREDISS